jgi:hypothetical protein
MSTDTEARGYVARGEAFEMIPRRVLQDSALSFRARGVLGYLLSQPDGWRTSAERLTRQGTEGRDAIGSALTELEGRGYLARHRVRVRGGRFRWIWIYGDDPARVAASAARGLARLAGTPSPENPVLVTPSPEKPDTAEPSTENQGSTTEDDLEKTIRESTTDSPSDLGSRPVPQDLCEDFEDDRYVSNAREERDPAPPRPAVARPSPTSESPGGAPDHPDTRAIRAAQREQRSPEALNKTARSTQAEAIVRRWARSSEQILVRSEGITLSKQIDALLREGHEERAIRAALTDWAHAGQYRRALAKHLQTALLESDNPLVTGKIRDEQVSVVLGHEFDPSMPRILRCSGGLLFPGQEPPYCTHDLDADPMPVFRDDETWRGEYEAWMERRDRATVEPEPPPRLPKGANPWVAPTPEYVALARATPVQRVDGQALSEWNRLIRDPWRAARRERAMAVLRAKAAAREAARASS